VGTGAGFALEALAIPTERLLAVEYRIGKVQAARQRVGVIHPIQGDALALPFGDASMDLVTCIEVLEHLVEPRLAVAELARVCRGACVVSVPSEPWFRLGSLARGKHLSSLGNHPEHIQQFNPRSLAQLLAAHFTDVVVERRTPWLLARAR
jgi:ubiquinone/menaquinone biosynthesis C-methylase UbiE